MSPAEEKGFLNDLLGNERTELPAHLSWEALESGVVAEEPRERRPPFWWLGGLLLLVLAIGSVRPSASAPEQDFVEEGTSSAGAVTVSEAALPAVAPVGEEQAPPIAAASSVKRVVNGAPATTRMVVGDTPPSVAPRATRSVLPIPTLAANPLVARANEPLLPAVSASLPDFRDQPWSLSAVAGAAVGDLPTPAAEISLLRQLGNGWFLSVGGSLNHYVERSRLQTTEAVNLYRPGTVDTIFLSPFPGNERTVTTDSVAGIRNRDFQDFGRVTALGVPITLGKSWSLGTGELFLAAGVQPTFVVRRAGRTVREGEVIAVADGERFGDDFYLQASFRGGYLKWLGPRWGVSVNAGLDLAREETRTTLGLGLRYRW